MKLPQRILSRRGFIASGILAGLVAPFTKPERVEATPEAALAPQIKVTQFMVPYTDVGTVRATFQRARVLGNFLVENSASLIEVTYQGQLYVGSMVNGSAIYFQLRVDNIPPAENTGQGIISSTQVGKPVNATFTAYWSNLSQGSHALSVWFGGWIGISGTGVTGSNVILNHGDDNRDYIFVKEYLPFGTTYLPTIMK